MIYAVSAGCTFLGRPGPLFWGTGADKEDDAESPPRPSRMLPRGLERSSSSQLSIDRARSRLRKEDGEDEGVTKVCKLWMAAHVCASIISRLFFSFCSSLIKCSMRASFSSLDLMRAAISLSFSSFSTLTVSFSLLENCSNSASAKGKRRGRDDVSHIEDGE